MRWSGAPHGGFTAGRPWLPLGDGIDSCNVEHQRQDPRSMLSLHRNLLALRRRHPALSLGSYIGYPADDECLVFARGHGAERILVMLNFSKNRRSMRLPAGMQRGQILFSSAGERGGSVIGTVELDPAEGLLIIAN